MLFRLRILLAALVCGLAVPAISQASGGSYVFDGGTASERATVRSGLDASSFDWSVVPATIKVHIDRAHTSEATKGEIWLDADLLDSGSFAWGVVQHEYAHQVDFFLLDDAKRAELQAALGGSDWCYSVPGLTHGAYGCERFASTLAWAYWPSSANCMRPDSKTAESGTVAPAAFRALVGRLLGTPTRSLLSRRLR
jgi:hypothetical protein